MASCSSYHASQVQPSIGPATRRTSSSLSNSSFCSSEFSPETNCPIDLWRTIFSYLPVSDLCHCAQVCRNWYHLVESLDLTVWRRHFLQSREWRHPAWPLNSDQYEVKSWQKLYREHYQVSRMWARNVAGSPQAHCMGLFHRRRERRTIRVGPGHQHSTLKSALSAALDYDRILLAPGLYDEQFEMVSRMPFELMGDGEPGSVVLLTCIEQLAVAGRLCNLVLRAPWFTAHVINVVSGHLQMDNCVIEDGHISVRSPATCHMRYCSFVHTQLALHNVSVSLIENCQMTRAESCAISIEGEPKVTSSWIHPYLLRTADTYNLRTSPCDDDDGDEDDDNVDREDCDEISEAGDLEEHLEESDVLASVDSASIVTIMHTAGAPSTSAPVQRDEALKQPVVPSSAESQPRTHASSPHSQPPSPQPSLSHSLPSTPSSSSSDLTDTSSDSSCFGSISTSHPWVNQSKLAFTLPSHEPALQWDTDPIPSIPEFLASNWAYQELISDIKGVIIRHCKISQCQGGISLSRSAQARIEKCELAEIQYGLRCLQNTKISLLETSIHHCSSSAIFMRIHASGLILGNDIYCTSEAGIDLRKYANPLIQHNKIHHSKRSGIVVLSNGKGTIKANDIYQNREAGIYILYHGDPYISGNRICHGAASGVAVTDDGKGYIVDNLVSGNRWGGVDVRRSGNPTVTRNLICNGWTDGVVIGSRGRGTIEANSIRGNQGCGIWVMSGRPLIQANQIYNNRDSGILLISTDGGFESDDSPWSAGDSDSETGGGMSQVLNSITETSTSTFRRNHQIQIKYNSIYHNSGTGIVSNIHERVLLQANAVHANRGLGVEILQVLPVILQRCSITSNNGHAVRIATNGRVHITGCGFYDNVGHGLVSDGDLVLQHSDILCNKFSGIFAQELSNIQVEYCRLFAAYDSAVLVASGGKAEIRNNVIYKGRDDQVVTFTLADQQCKQINNEIIEPVESDKSNNWRFDWELDDPPPRPVMEPPPEVIIAPSPFRCADMSSRLVVPSHADCHQGSKLCIIL